VNGYFIARSGTRHIIGSKLHSGRLVALWRFSQSPDEETPAEAMLICAWCLKAEERARQIVHAALE
jgi:hypothetical protein